MHGGGGGHGGGTRKTKDYFSKHFGNSNVIPLDNNQNYDLP